MRRWALGEIDSKFFGGNDSQARMARELLTSTNEQDICQGIRQFLKHSTRPNMAGLLSSFPRDTEWHEARLEIMLSEFENLRTMAIRKWGELSQGTFRLVTAAEAFGKTPELDSRITSIRESLRNGTASLIGITLMAESLTGPYTIAEGHGRLVAHYLDCVIKQNSSYCPTEIEVILGITSTPWKFSPPNVRSQSIAT